MRMRLAYGIQKLLKMPRQNRNNETPRARLQNKTTTIARCREMALTATYSLRSGFDLSRLAIRVTQAVCAFRAIKTQLCVPPRLSLMVGQRAACELPRLCRGCDHLVHHYHGLTSTSSP